MWAHRPGLCRGRGPEDRKKADCAEQTVSPLTWGWEEGDMQREADALGEGRRDLATAAGHIQSVEHTISTRTPKRTCPRVPILEEQTTHTHTLESSPEPREALRSMEERKARGSPHQASGALAPPSLATHGPGDFS